MTNEHDSSDHNFEREEQLDRDLEREPHQPNPIPAREEGIERSAMFGAFAVDVSERPDEDVSAVNDQDALDATLAVSRLGIYGEG
jgi:hypothetical protein